MVKTKMSNFDQTRSFNLGIAETASVDAALIYDELSFWMTKSKNGWVYKSYDDFIERLPFMSEYKIRQAINQLENAGFIEKKLKKANNVPTLHFRFLKNLRMDSEKIKESGTEVDSEKIKESINSNSTATQNTKKNLEPFFFSLVDILKGNPARTLFTDGRHSKLKARLKNFTKEEITAAARAIAADPFMQGENDSNKKYGTVDYLLRNDEKLEHWRDRAPQQPEGYVPPTPEEQAKIDELNRVEDWNDGDK